MAEFSAYDPAATGLPALPIQVRRLELSDIDACALLASARQGEPVDRWRSTFTAAYNDPDQIVLVACHEGACVGYGKAAHLDPGANGGRNTPPGWYLTGVVVAPSHRRRGIARRLTLARLEALAERRADEVWFFAAAQNQASIRLHEALGFREVTRDFAFPGVAFTGGAGVLMNWRPGRCSTA